MTAIAQAVQRGAPIVPVLQGIGVVTLFVYWILSPVPTGSDAHNYWSLDLSDPYRNRWFALESFVYSPAFGQVIYPFTELPVWAFYKLMQAVNIVCLGWLIGPALGALSLLTPPAQVELTTNNIHLPLAVMCVLGLRYPGAWAFGLLTKVTPGVVAFWYLARWEWRPIAVCAVVTAAIIVASYLTLPNAWPEWVGLLLESPTRVEEGFALSDWPVVFRLPIAVGLMVMARWRERPAAIPAIVCFALPAIWVGSLTLLAATIRLAGWRISRRGLAQTPHRPGPESSDSAPGAASHRAPDLGIARWRRKSRPLRYGSSMEKARTDS